MATVDSTIDLLDMLATAAERMGPSEESLRSLIEESHDGMVVAGADSTIRLVNSSACQILGQDQAELIGQVFLSRPRYGSIVEREIVREDETSSIVEIAAADLEYEGEPAYLALIKDVTLTRRAEALLEDTGPLGPVGHVAARLAHELNEPLQSVLGYSELARGREMTQETRDLLDVVAANAMKATRIIRNLSFFGVAPTPVMQPLDLSDIVRNALEQKAHDLKRACIEVATTFAEDLPRTLMDESQVTDALVNVITNAEQAIQESDRPGKLNVSVSVEDGRVRASVEDNGAGFEEGVLERVFEPFFSARSQGQGVGLGLSVANQIASDHEGRLSAESAPSGGAILSLELPIRDRPDDEFDSDAGQIAESVVGLSVLVVDDQPDVRALVTAVLQDAGHEVDVAPDGPTALERLEEGNYDCVLLDLRLPGMSGEDVYRHATQSGVFASERFIFITGDTLSPDTQEFLSDVVGFHVSKPFSMAELTDEIARWRRSLN